MATITEDYVSFETAKLLKEKGFKGSGSHFYKKGMLVDFHNYWWRITPKERYEAIEAPTLQMAMKWLREVYRLDINISIEYTPKKVYYYSILKKTVIRDIDCLHSETNFDSYEQSCEAAIKYCLKNW